MYWSIFSELTREHCKLDLNGVHAVTSPQTPVFSGAVPVHKVFVVFTFTGASTVN